MTYMEPKIMGTFFQSRFPLRGLLFVYQVDIKQSGTDL